MMLGPVDVSSGLSIYSFKMMHKASVGQQKMLKF